MKYVKKSILAAVLVITMLMTLSLSAFAANITEKEAKVIALKEAGLKASKIRCYECEYEKGIYEIEFHSKKKNNEYEIKVDAATGVIKEYSIEYAHKKNTSKEKIGKKAALKKAAKASGKKLSVVKAGTCKYKKDSGEWIYEVKFKNGNYKYEYEILAPTGKIVEMERKYLK